MVAALSRPRAGVVDAMLRAHVRVPESNRDQNQRGCAHRQVHIENPAPGKRVGDHAA